MKKKTRSVLPAVNKIIEKTQTSTAKQLIPLHHNLDPWIKQGKRVNVGSATR